MKPTDAAAIGVIVMAMVLGWAVYPMELYKKEPSAQRFVQADGYYNNETKWQDHNRQKRIGCVLTIIKVAPPSATPEELDWNLEQCLLQNNVFI
jgi:hypothetical protein